MAVSARYFHAGGNPESLITDNLDIWSSAVKAKSARGRGASKKIDLYGIKKLRELILDLAVRGLLVPQDPNDEPASELLKKIAIEKIKLIKEGKIKKQKPLPPIVKDEKPFELPVGWEWTKLGEIGIIASSSRVHKKDWTNSGVPFYRAREIVQLSKFGEVNNELFISDEHFRNLSKNGYVPEVNDLMLTGVGTIGVPYVVKNEAKFYFKDASVLIYKNIFNLVPDFLNYFFKSPVWIKAIHDGSMGTTVHTLTISRANEIPFPILSLVEQSRIVAKVDELMALCDQLEQQTETSISAHQTLVQTLLETLTNTSERDDFNQAWARIAEHFDTLFTTEWSIDQLKQTILQLAVMGKLVPQEPNDEPASVLLETIAVEKDRLIKETKIKKQKVLPEITEDEMPFELPVGWSWSKCQDVCYKITDGEHATPKRTEKGHYLLSARNVTNEGIIVNDVDFVPTSEFDRIRNRCDPNIGDVLISCSGSVGRVALVDKDNAYSMVRSAAMIRPDSNCLVVEYIAILLRSPYLQAQIKNRSKQSAQANLFLGAISNLVFVLPPKSEQYRIVTKVNELMLLCEYIKNDLTNAQLTQLHLSDAIAEQAID